MSDGSPPGEPDEPDENLTADLRALTSPGREDVAALYNGLQGMEDEAFRAAFEGSFETLKDVAGAGPPELASVLGLELDGGSVTDATLLSVHVREGDRVVYTDDDADVPDAAVYLPVRPEDFPPGSGEALADLDVDEYREVVSAMVFLRHQLARESPDQLESRYREPLRRGLRAYATGSSAE